MDFLLGIAEFLNNQYEAFLLLLSAFALLASRKKGVFLISLLLVLLLLPVLKGLYQQQRPCETASSPVVCDGTYGFPSGHAATAAVVALGLLGTGPFFLFLPLAYFIAWTRMLINVHTLTQVAGGVALGAVAFFLVDSAVSAWKGEGERKSVVRGQEQNRQLFHLYFGVLVVSVAAALGIAAVQVFLLAGLFVGAFVLNFRLMGYSNSLLDALLGALERRSAAFPGKGALYYIVGMLFLFTFSKNPSFALAGAAVLAVADAMSTLAGVKFGELRLPWNPRKSLEGLVAFWITGMAVAALIIPSAFWFALVLGVVETLDFHFDDNLLIPLAAVLLGYVL